MARWHLLHCVDVNINVCCGIRGVQHLPERQDKAACVILEVKEEESIIIHFVYRILIKIKEATG